MKPPTYTRNWSPKISTEDTNTTHEPTDEIKDKESIDKIDNNKGLTETNTSGDNTKQIWD